MRPFNAYFFQKHRDVQEQRSAIKKVLDGGPSTVSKIAEITKLPKDLIVWNLLAMLRWGAVDVAGEDEHEPVYKLKEA